MPRADSFCSSTNHILILYVKKVIATNSVKWLICLPLHDVTFSVPVVILMILVRTPNFSDLFTSEVT